MGVFDKFREKRRKRKFYKKLLKLCLIELQTGTPYEFDLPPAFMYLEAGKYEQYFKDLELIYKKRLKERRSKLEIN